MSSSIYWAGPFKGIKSPTKLLKQAVNIFKKIKTLIKLLYGPLVC